MKTETILAISGLSATAIVSLAGIIATAVTAGKGRQETKELANTARMQQRLSDAYIDVLQFVEVVGSWCQLVRPSVGPEVGVKLPEQDAEVATKAKLAGYGSQRVKELYAAWRKCVTEVQEADLRIGLRLAKAEEHRTMPMQEGKDQSWRDPLPAWETLDEKLRPAEKAARQSLIDQISSELT